MTRAALRRLVARGACVALLLAAVPGSARPTVCVALSGGGARGAAHVGVLRVLESLRVPVDCIAGTSMGSIVGAAYAAGMSVDEMAAVIERISTAGLFRERLPRDQQAIRRKIDDRSILLGLDLGFNDGDIDLPKGIVSGVQLETVLRSLVKLEGWRNFDELPIRYRAVATDLVTGRAVVFDRGDLPGVMRASMSVPGVIAPAEVNGRVLVDGGLTDNLPVDVARAMGADIVIAVNLGTPLLQREALTSVLGVTTQMINILTEQNVRASLASLRDTDILIEPQLGDFSAANFDELRKTIPIGEAAARVAAPRLSALSLSPEAFAALRARQVAMAAAQPAPPIDEVRFAPMHRVNPEVLRGLMGTRAGQPLDRAVVDRDMLRLYGTGDFEHVDYRLLEEAGKRVLVVDAVEKSWGPNYLRFGLGLGTDLQGNSFFNLAASYRRTWINALGAEWRTDAQMGRSSRLVTELYQPLGASGRWFVAPRAGVGRRHVDLFEGNQRVATYRLREAAVGLDVGATLGPLGEVRVGYVTGRLKPTLDTGPDALAPPDSSVREGALTARAVIDQLDSANFPHAGYAASAHVFASRKALGATDDYVKWDVDGTAAFSRGRHTVSVAGKLGGPLGGASIPRYDLFQWGGLLQQSGYPIGALLGERLAFGRVVYSYRLADQRLFEGVYAGASLEVGRMDRPLVENSPTGLLASTALFLGLDSPLGPLYVGYGIAADGNRSAYLFLGRP
jgi:NTE family protein